MNLQIIQATIKNLDAIYPLFDKYRVFYKQTSNLDGSKAFIKERLEQKDSVIFLAIDNINGNSTYLGFTQLYPSFSSPAMQRRWILNDLYIDEPYRKQGIVKALMKKAEEFALETKAHSLMLAIAVDNEPAKTLYESLDWKKNESFDFYFRSL